VTGVETSSKAYNVIPELVEIRGTFRTFDQKTSEQIERHIRDMSESICDMMGCTAQVNVTHQTIPVINNAQVTARARRVFAAIAGEAALDPQARTLASEDVSYLMEDAPGTYILLGASNPVRGLTYGHHHPRFDFDEDALPLGVALMSAAVADYLMQDGE
jgi:amidohydrolase